MSDVPVPGFRNYWTQKLVPLKPECHAIMNKYREAVSVVQQVHKVLSDIEKRAGCTPAEVGGNSEWTSALNSAERSRPNFCKALDGKPLFSALCGMYAVTLGEQKAVLKMSAQTGQRDAVNRTSVESTAQDDDFQDVKRHKRHISNNTSQTAKKSIKPVPTSVALKLPPKAVLTSNFFAPLNY
jgi:hypothetical protein